MRVRVRIEVGSRVRVRLIVRINVRGLPNEEYWILSDL